MGERRHRSEWVTTIDLSASLGRSNSIELKLPIAAYAALLYCVLTTATAIPPSQPREMTMTTTIQFDQSGESQLFTASRDIRNSEHASGTIEAGQRVFFRRDDAGRVTLLHETGEPTNGNQYAEWVSAHEAVDFAAQYGLVARDDPRETAHFEIRARPTSTDQHAPRIISGPVLAAQAWIGAGELYRRENSLYYVLDGVDYDAEVRAGGDWHEIGYWDADGEWTRITLNRHAPGVAANV